MRSKLSILLGIILICIVSSLFALQRNEYSYAAGVNNEIEVNWKYISENNDFLGCNLLRYDSLSTICTQVNDTLITSNNHVFSFIDTQSIIDTVDYQYEIEYVFTDTTDTNSFPFFALKRLDFEIQPDEEINVILEFRKNTGYFCEFYVSLQNTLWELLYYDYIDQVDTLFIDPYTFQYLGNYLLIAFLDYTLENPYQGYIKLSMDYLIEIIEGTNTENELIVDNRQLKISNYPNPFNPTTTISFNLPENSINTIIEIFNVKGQRIRKLKIENEKLKINSIVWDGKDLNNNSQSSGIYFYRIKTDDYASTAKKMLLLK